MSNDKATPTTLIKPSSSWLELNLKELWTYRELLYFLTWRDVKVRYKQTAVGVLWVILQPVLTTAIFTVIFSQVARFDSPNISYPLFALSGFLIWIFVYNSVSFASNSLVSHTNLVTKVYFPRLIMPIASTLAFVVDLLFSLALLALLMIYYQIAPSWQMALAPVFLVLAFGLTVSLGTLFAALNVRFRDVKFALPFLLQVWLFVSPVFYPLEILSAKVRFVFSFNPLTGILQGFRTSLFGGEFDWFAIGVAAVAIVFLFLLSLFVFKRMEDDFADLI